MQSINLKLLHTFVIVSERGSFRRAAAELHRSPSAISMQIKALEDQVGTGLFSRTSNQLMLTDSGRVLYDRIKDAMTDVQAGLDALARNAEPLHQNIAIGCAPTLAFSLLPGIMADFKHKNPSCKIHLKEISPAAGLELLKNEEIEFYFGPSGSQMIDFDFEPIAADPLLACSPPVYDRGESTMSMQGLAGVPLILLSPNTAVRATIDLLAAERKVVFRPQFEVQQATTALAIASLGLGVAVLPKTATAQTQAQKLRLIPISEGGALREIGIVVRRGHVTKSLTRRLIDLVKSSVIKQVI